MNKAIQNGGQMYKDNIGKFTTIIMCIICAAAAYVLFIHPYLNEGLDVAQRVATGAATLDLIAHPDTYESDLDREVYRQIAAMGETAQAATDHDHQGQITYAFPMTQQAMSWDSKRLTYRFCTRYAGTSATVRVDEYFQWRWGNRKWVVAGIAWHLENTAPSCKEKPLAEE